MPSTVQISSSGGHLFVWVTPAVLGQEQENHLPSTLERATQYPLESTSPLLPWFLHQLPDQEDRERMHPSRTQIRVPKLPCNRELLCPSWPRFFTLALRTRKTAPLSLTRRLLGPFHPAWRLPCLAVQLG
jgi:hypothetical protein